MIIKNVSLETVCGITRKLPENIQRMNMCFKEIKDLFASAGIDDFSRLP